MLCCNTRSWERAISLRRCRRSACGTPCSIKIVSYSALQEDFFKEVSEKYGAKRGESFSLIKNTVESQRQRYHRTDGDLYDELYYDGY